ncbi:MAG: S8 family serine peptidase [Anaerolineae bacterium]|nr:S8 family serine peptidase [Anaerolineae bacterium]MDQ7034469.1 S8 family serine peptidase [Anaerolineae bacterium]
MSSFVPNYPHPEKALLTTPERIDASPHYSGRGVVIAYLDSGFYMHPDIADRLRLHVDATTRQIKEQSRVEQADTTSWHGLMVAAIGSGNGAASNGKYRAVACESDLVLVKISNPKGGVKEADILRGMKWLVRHHARMNIRIVNVSVGGDVISTNPDHPLHHCVRDLTKAGVTVVIAAGNQGDSHLVPPASSPEAIVVGGYNDNNSLNRSDWTTYHSNYGTAYDGTNKPDIIAPAQWIASPILPQTIVEKEAHWLGSLLQSGNKEAVKNLLAHGLADLDIPKPKTRRLGKSLHRTLQDRIYAHKLIHEKYQHVDGTSVAAPIVSSVIAQMLEANPKLTPSQIRTILKETATPLAGIVLEQQGAGVIHAKEAVAQALHQRHTPSFT